ncbi:MAG: efflux RND transporter permease subunit [Reichenbachiella sp.]
MKVTKKSSIISIVITLCVLALMGTQILNLKFNNDLDAFFPVSDPDLIYYQEFTETFGEDSDFLLIALDNKQGVFKQDFLLKADSFIRDIKKSKYTIKVISLVNLKKTVKTPMGYLEYPYLHIKDANKLTQDSINIYKERHIRDQFLAQNINSTRIVISHHKLKDKTESDQYINFLETLLDTYDFDGTHLAGKPIGARAYVWAVQRDFTFFLIFSGATIIIMLIIFIRRASMVAASLLISFLSVFATMSFMGMVGKDIDILSTLIPSILLVVSMSDIIHLYAHTKESFLNGSTLPEAINDAVKKVGFATLLTSLTTAIGFITLMSIRVQPIIDLGIYSAVGIVFAFILTYLLFPQIMFLVKPQLNKRKKNWRIQAFLMQLFDWVLRKQKFILISFSIATIAIIVGISQLEINAYLIDDLPKDHPVKEDFLFFDREYRGTKPFTMTVWTQDTTDNIYTKDNILTLAQIQDSVLRHITISNVSSPVTIVKSVNQILSGGSKGMYALPTLDKDWNKVFRFIKKGKVEERFIKMTHNNLAVISGFSQDLGSKRGMEERALLMQALSTSIDQNIYDYRITGSSQLIEKSQETLSLNLLKGLFGAIIIVSIIAGFMFKSWRMMLITLIPNLFPIMAIAAVMGFFGIPINLGTSIIFAISFGIVVDDTIHFLSKMREERLQGRTMVYAIKRTIMATGEPIIITTIILTSGFIIFCFSQFAATFNTGLFVSVSFIVALIADLTLLPVLILYFLPRRILGKQKD